MAHDLRTELCLGALNRVIGRRRLTEVVIIPTRVPSTPRWPSASAARRWECGPPLGRPAIASTTPWPRASSPPWSASYPTAGVSDRGRGTHDDGLHGETDLGAFPIRQSNAHDHPLGLPVPSLTEKNLLPAADAYLSAVGDSLELSTKAG